MYWPLYQKTAALMDVETFQVLNVMVGESPLRNQKVIKLNQLFAQCNYYERRKKKGKVAQQP